MQCVLVAMFYSIGLGLGALFADRALVTSLEPRDVAWIGGFVALTVPLAGLVAYRESAQVSGAAGRQQIPVGNTNEDDFTVLPRTVTPEGFYRGWHLLTDALLGLPRAITNIYEQQNGGAVRFRFAPPQVVNASGYTNPQPSAKEWVDVFPDGLLPFEDWRPFEVWRQE